MIIFIDIDNTICKTNGTDYENAKPDYIAINKANELYIKGHSITYWTARGTGSGIDYTELILKQFKQWGVLFHDVKIGKPIYDLFIDDKNISVEAWLNE